MAPALCHDWARRYFSCRAPRPDLEDVLPERFVYAGTSLEYAARSAEGLEGTVLAARRSDPRPGARSWLLWHGRQRFVEESFGGWFGPRFQPVSRSALALLLDRLPHVLVVDPASRPTFVVPLDAFVRLGASHGVLETLLGARVIVAAEGLFARAAHVPSLRVYVDYDGARYAAGTRKLFRDAAGRATTVEAVARDVLRRLAYDAVPPVVFRRFFHALVGRPASHLVPGAWPELFLEGRLSPLEWAARGRRRLRGAAEAGFLEALERALAALARRPYAEPAPSQGGAVPMVGRYLSRPRFASLVDAIGDARLMHLLEGLLLGYEAASADWFAWRAGERRAFFCEVKSRGDTLRETQKQTILWCQRSGMMEYRLLEILHAN